jgi:hypothetical protein
MARWLMVVAALLAVTPAQAQTSIVPKDTSRPPAVTIPSDPSANYILPYCEDQAQPDYQLERRWFCAGAIYALMSVLSEAKHACVPEGATESQGGRIVVRYISARPERLHEPFLSLASEAIRDAWPCTPPPDRHPGNLTDRGRLHRLLGGFFVRTRTAPCRRGSPGRSSC